MSYSSRFWLYAPLCLLLALTGWVAWHWWQVASALDRRLDALKGREAVPGVIVDWQAKTLSGFPFRLDLVFDGLQIRGAGARGPFDWKAEKFAVHALTYGQDKQVMEAAGRQSLSWTGDDGAHRLTFLPAELHASSVFDARGLARFDLDILDAGGEDGGGGRFTAGRLQLHARRDPQQDGIDLQASIGELKTGAIPAFGLVLHGLQVYAEIAPGSAFAGALRGEAALPQAHAAWLRQGGAVRLQPSPSGAQAEALSRLLSPLY